MLIEQIDQDLKAALKEKNEVVLSALRNLKAAVKNAEIAAQTLSGRASPTDGGRESQKALTDDLVLSVMAKKVKQHKDSIASFISGARNDLVAHEQAQMAVLQKYLPAEISEEEVTAAVKQVITDLDAKVSDFGKVMKEVMTKLKGRADGNLISKIVKENLK